ncbi:MAG: hypothetical protein NT089_02070 [Planctomycetia bacterium]|nr:hypothetical protein [Planctomycetia bacterium]
MTDSTDRLPRANAATLRRIPSKKRYPNKNNDRAERQGRAQKTAESQRLHEKLAQLAQQSLARPQPAAFPLFIAEGEIAGTLERSGPRPYDSV